MSVKILVISFLVIFAGCNEIQNQTVTCDNGKSYEVIGHIYNCHPSSYRFRTKTKDNTVVMMRVPVQNCYISYPVNK